MSKIKDMIIDVAELLEVGSNPDEIAYFISHNYDIPYTREVSEIVSQVRSTMNLANDCLEEVAQRF